MSTVKNRFLADLTVVPPSVKKLRIYPVKDSVIKESKPKLNYGSFGSLNISGDNEGDNMALFGFAGIDLASLSELAPITVDRIKSVKLGLYASRMYSDDVEINIGQSENNWTEAGVTWANYVQKKTPFHTMTLPKGDTFISLDLTQNFIDHYDDIYSKDFGFEVWSDDISDFALAVNSKEQSTGIPYIDLYYYDYEKSPLNIYVPFEYEVKAIMPSVNIPFTLEIDSQHIRKDVPFTFTPAKIPVHLDYDGEDRGRTDIAFSFTYKKDLVLDIPFSITIPKFPINKDYDGNDVGYPEIAITFDVINTMPALTIPFTMTIPKIPLNNDYDGVDVGYPEIGFTYSVREGAFVYIPFTITIPKIPLNKDY